MALVFKFSEMRGSQEIMLEKVIEYHHITKHNFNHYAPGPRGLDWKNQPNPFRRYDGSRIVPLTKVDITDEPLYDTIFNKNGIEPKAVNFNTISQFFYDSLAISAWKQLGLEKWSLRINPASGNLQPTEGYIICGPIQGIGTQPFIAHYAPKEHSLEIRLEFPLNLWKKLIEGGPESVFFIGLTSIHWRTSWKYGERAFRYVNLDLGHALSALGFAAEGLGWRIKLLDNVSSKDLIQFLGIGESSGAEAEYPDCLLALVPSRSQSEVGEVPDEIINAIGGGKWRGKPNKLSVQQVEWPQLSNIAKETFFPNKKVPYSQDISFKLKNPMEFRQNSLRRIIHQRRSALGMDGRTLMPEEDFYQMLIRTTVPLLPWGSNVNFAIFIHRVVGLEPGLYFQIRNEILHDDLKDSLSSEFEWQKPRKCPDDLNLYLLMRGDARRVARNLSCHQEIASDGSFSLGMVSRFEEPLKQYGAWFYPRLYWECGMLGQILYLEAENIRFRACGIGCYFDDPMHDLLGLKGLKYQDLYHFTVGKPVEDPRLTA